jgi:hypothetical protein
MSAPKMGEYLGASAARRERILLDQKFPPTFKCARYRDAEVALRSALLDGGDVSVRLGELANRLRETITTSEYRDVAKRCSVQALLRFARLFSRLPTRDAEFFLPGSTNAVLDVEGVAISVYPLVLSRRIVRRQMRLGAVLGVFQKTQPLSDRSAQAVAELLRLAISESGLPDVHPSDCLVVDIFRGSIHAASTRGQKRLLSEVESACREIAVRWSSLGETQAA